MNILDHRILIPKSPETVWEYISDISKNPDWQVDCNNVSILTPSRREGVGVRWRYTTPAGREYVAETTAWYDGLGYEYTFVDGAPYRESKGRIRLQEIPEGTIVQWTFNYDMGGLLSGVRNAVSTKRQVENAMMDGLRMLWKVIQQASPGEKHEAKSAMRDAPDYEGRLQYKPRHPSSKSQKAEEELQATVPVNIVEPSIAEDDTRPRRPVVETPAPSEPEKPILTPAFVEAVEVPSVAVTSEHPTSEDLPVAQVLPIEEVVPETTVVEEFSVPPTVVEETPPHVAPVEKVDDAREVLEVSVPTEEFEKPTSFTTTQVDQPKVTPEYIASMDTAEISVFEVFGLPRPSQTQEMKVITATLDEPVAVPSPKVMREVEFSRMGLRIILRRKRVKVRRPG